MKALANNIYRLLCGGEDAPAPVEKAPVRDDGESVYDAFRVEEEEDDLVSALKDTSIVAGGGVDLAEIDDSPVDAPAAITAEIPSPANDPTPTVVIPAVTEDETTADVEQITMDIDEDDDSFVTPDLSAFTDQSISSDTIIMDTPASSTADPVPDPEEEEFTEFTFNDLPRRKEKSVGGTVLFYSLFILSLPVTLTLFLIGMSLFGILYLVLGVCTGVFFTLIFGTAVAGGLFALSGGMYGANQINIGGGAVGLFELGLALILVGVTILACFLFSMIALKWLPALLKYLTRFLRFCLDKLLTLIKYLKGRCEQL